MSKKKFAVGDRPFICFEPGPGEHPQSVTDKGQCAIQEHHMDQEAFWVLKECTDGGVCSLRELFPCSLQLVEKLLGLKAAGKFEYRFSVYKNHGKQSPIPEKLTDEEVRDWIKKSHAVLKRSDDKVYTVETHETGVYCGGVLVGIDRHGGDGKKSVHIKRGGKKRNNIG